MVRARCCGARSEVLEREARRGAPRDSDMQPARLLLADEESGSAQCGAGRAALCGLGLQTWQLCPGKACADTARERSSRFAHPFRAILEITVKRDARQPRLAARGRGEGPQQGMSCER